MKSALILKYKCDMLIDQNIKVEGDLIGRHCQNDSFIEIYVEGQPYLMCQDCYEMWHNSEEFTRLTFPQMGGSQYFLKILYCILENWGKNV